MPQKMIQVDAFTSQPFAGNPAAVCLLPQAKPENWMQAVAVEMNLSETAFLVKQGDGYNLRWFTPACEVDLCGHATLASAYMLWEEGYCGRDEQIRFHTKSGELTAVLENGWIVLDFPATEENAVDQENELMAALGIQEAYLGKTRFDYLVELTSAELVRELLPDFGALKKLNVRGVIVTAVSDDDRFDFISRFFAPGAGIDEDPVTGSAHCCLAPYWGKKLNKTEMTGYQASKRGGVVKVIWRGERVNLMGQAVTTMRGELLCG